MIDITKIRDGDVLIAKDGKTYGAVSLIDVERNLVGLKTRDGIRPFEPGQLKYLSHFLGERKNERGNINQSQSQNSHIWKGFVLSLLKKMNSSELSGTEKEILQELENNSRVKEIKAMEILEALVRK